MADPAIQTFCCIANNRTRLVVDSVLHYRYESYNIICIVSSIFGILGSCYQILPRKFEGGPGHVLSSFLRGRRIIVWLATADLLASIAVLIRSSSWLISQALAVEQSYSLGSIFCAISSGWIQYFYGVTYLWTFLYAIDVLRMVNGLPGNFVLYHTIAWSVPLLLTVIGLTILYFPDLNCHSMESNIFLRILPNYCITYVPIILIMLINPLIYLKASEQAKTVIAGSGRFTSHERKQLRILRLKFLSINLVFIICWIPNLVNAIAVWSLLYDAPHEPILITAYVMAILNPLQALFNVFVYRKWGDPDHPSTVRIQLPWPTRGVSSESIHLLHDTDTTGPNSIRDDLSLSTSVMPLGKRKAKHSINGYGSL